MGLPFLFEGTVDNVQTIVLLDSGCNSNVVSAEWCRQHGKVSTPCIAVPVSFANGEVTSFQQQVRVQVRIGDWTNEVVCFVGEIEATLILGVPFLTSVVVTWLNWSRGVFRFIDNGTQYQWNGSDHSSRMPMLIRACELHTLPSRSMMFSVHIRDGNKETSSPGPEWSHVIREFKDVFEEPTRLPPKRPEDIHIELIPDAPMPKWRSLPRLSETELQVLRDKLDELLAKGYIRPSTSPFGAAVLFVKKADGSLRMCLDYRGLNEVTVKNRGPIPNISELRERVTGAKVFSKLDLREGYYNLRVAEEHVHKTAFRTRYGHFEFRVLPFGLTNAPSVFQAMMNRVLRPFLDRFVIAYLDDIVIFSRTEAEHIEHLRMVLLTIRENKLALKLSKCQFGEPRVAFCGHMLSKEGVEMLEEKRKAMAARPIITGPKDIRSWLGACVWFKDFIPGFAKLSQPLTDLTRKDRPWVWTKECEKAVSDLIEAITNAPVLRHFDPRRKTFVYTDASLFAIGGWVGQEYADGIHPTVYWSRKLLAAEQNYPVHERELLALVEMLTRFGHLLRGTKFIARTDHRALEWIQTQEKLSYRQARWVLLLQEFDFQLEYLPGRFNNVADYLSRSPLVAPLCSRCSGRISLGAIGIASNSSLVRAIGNGLRTDNLAIALVAAQLRVQQGEASGSDRSLLLGYTLRGGLWYKGNRIYVPEVEAIRTSLLARYHDAITAGHQGTQRTLERLARFYYWPGMGVAVKEYVSTCDACQRFNASNRKPVGVLHPLPVPSDRFLELSIDFAALPAAESGADAVLVIVDRLTKLCAFIPGQRTDTAEQVAERFLTGWYCKGAGLPKVITSDRDSRFLSAFWRTLCARLQIKQELTTARHQQADGQAERAVGLMKAILRKYVERGDATWDLRLPFIEFAVNNSVSASTGFTPFYLAYGFHPREPESHQEERQTDLLKQLSDAMTLARDNLFHAQDVQTVDFDRRHSAPQVFGPGELVLLAAEGISWPADVQHPPVFSPKWLGPFPVKSCDDAGRNNYQLVLPQTLSRLYPIFHVSKLRGFRLSNKFPSRKGSSRPDPIFGADGKARYEVDRILDKRVYGRGKGTRIAYLVKWVGYPEHEADWIDYSPTDAEWDEDRHKVVEFETWKGTKRLEGMSR